MEGELWWCGDPHGDFAPLIDAAQVALRERRAPGAVVLLGDLDLDAPLEQVLAPLIEAGIGVWWIVGNHDGDRAHWHDRLFGSALAENNLSGRVVALGGLRIAGLGGVFRERIWYPPGAPRFATREDYLRTLAPQRRWRGGLPMRDRATLWWEDYAALWECEADVLVTHEAPGCHHHGFTVLDELAESMGARRIVHGHHHEGYCTTLANGIAVQGVGLAGVTALDGTVIKAGKLDRQRAGRWRGPSGNVKGDKR